MRRIIIIITIIIIIFIIIIIIIIIINIIIVIIIIIIIIFFGGDGGRAKYKTFFLWVEKSILSGACETFLCLKYWVLLGKYRNFLSGKFFWGRNFFLWVHQVAALVTNDGVNSYLMVL